MNLRSTHMAQLRQQVRTAAAIFNPSNSLFALMFMVSIFAIGSRAHAADGALTEPDQQCLNCNSTPGFEKRFTNGEKLSLHIRRAPFAESVHPVIGCAGCHTDI